MDALTYDYSMGSVAGTVKTHLDFAKRVAAYLRTAKFIDEDASTQAAELFRGVAGTVERGTAACIEFWTAAETALADHAFDDLPVTGPAAAALAEYCEK
eukprot:3566541-Pyramimonas_sp.AAC.1